MRPQPRQPAMRPVRIEKRVAGGRKKPSPQRIFVARERLGFPCADKNGLENIPARLRVLAHPQEVIVNGASVCGIYFPEPAGMAASRASRFGQSIDGIFAGTGKFRVFLRHIAPIIIIQGNKANLNS
jgi:hypothetical protein